MLQYTTTWIKKWIKTDNFKLAFYSIELITMIAIITNAIHQW
jgi:hypothetical protein